MIFFYHSSNGNFFCCPQLRYGDWNQIAAKQCDLLVCVCVGWANSSLDAIAVECAEPTFLQFWKQISIVPHCVVINDERRACNWLHLHQPQNTFQNIIQLSYCSLICSMFFIHSIFMQQIENKKTHSKRIRSIVPCGLSPLKLAYSKAAGIGSNRQLGMGSISIVPKQTDHNDRIFVSFSSTNEVVNNIKFNFMDSHCLICPFATVVYFRPIEIEWVFGWIHQHRSHILLSHASDCKMMIHEQDEHILQNVTEV